MRAKLHEFAKGWMELARNLIVASVLLALARRSQDWLVTLFAYATILIFVGHYLTYVLDAIMQTELPRSWHPYVGKWVLGSAFMAVVVIAKYSVACPRESSRRMLDALRARRSSRRSS